MRNSAGRPLKLIEIGKVMSIGYELEEGMQFVPTLGSPTACVLVMNDGGRENQRARGLAGCEKRVAAVRWS